MQIIIAQDEIELAIRNYIAEQINVRDNQQIDIDLKATRGEAGMQAFIDIRAANAAKREPVADTKPEPNLGLVKAINSAKEEAKPAEAKAEPAKDKDAEPEAASDAGEEAPSEGRQSLFGGLKRPVNA